MFIVENKIGNSCALKCRFLYYLELFLLVLGCISCFHLHFSSLKVRFTRFLLTFGRGFLHLRNITNCTHQRKIESSVRKRREMASGTTTYVPVLWRRLWRPANLPRGKPWVIPIPSSSLSSLSYLSRLLPFGCRWCLPLGALHEDEAWLYCYV